MPRCEEHCPADIQPDPFPVISPAGVDSRAVTDALRCGPARFGGAGGGCGRTFTCLVVFVVIIIVVIVGMGRKRTDVQ